MTPETPAQAVAPVKNIYQRMLEVMRMVTYIQKGGQNPTFKAKYVSHDAVMGIMHVPLMEAGIVMVPTMESSIKVDDKYLLHFSVDFINADDPSDRITTKVILPSQNKDEQKVGSAYSYACKYALLKVFMLETGEDADHVRYLPPDDINALQKEIGDDKELEKKILNVAKTTSFATIPSSKADEIEKAIEDYKNNKPISAEELEVLKVLIQDVKHENGSSLESAILAGYGLKELKDLPAKDYEKCLKGVRRRMEAL